MKNVTVGECKPGKKKKKTKFKSVGECKSGKTPTQAWKKKTRVQKRWRMQVWKKKTKFKSQGKCYIWNPEIK